MSDPVITPVLSMWAARGQLLNNFGKDQTGEISYQFNQQGFRSDKDYVDPPNYAFFGCSLVFGIGVKQEQIFSSYFTNSHNYGLAGQYENSDIYLTVQRFLESDLYSPKTKICIVWADRNTESLEKYYHNLDSGIFHFFCGDTMSHNNCYKFIKNVDSDISNTHIGPKTHLFFYKVLCNLFNQ